MGKSSSEIMFNMIAPVYGLFYNWQKKRFAQVIEAAKETLDLTCYETILDVGCGTGALCSVLEENELAVTGIDPAEKMLRIAMRKAGMKPIRFMRGNVLEKLPFEDKSYDVSIASYVAHGMGPRERKAMFAEMSRVTRHKIIIYDYNQTRGILTNIIEGLEGGDYFSFIKNAEAEMRLNFARVVVLNVTRQAAWYICTPFEEADK